VSDNGRIPPSTGLVPVTAAQLRQRMETLLSRVTPRVLSDVKVPVCFARIDPALLVEELHLWISDN
jgi:hypothetical protein